jgi:hypothetical protein
MTSKGVVGAAAVTPATRPAPREHKNLRGRRHERAPAPRRAPRPRSAALVRHALPSARGPWAAHLSAPDFSSWSLVYA